MPEVDFGLTDPGGVGGDPQRARHRQLAPAAERVAVDRRDDGLAQVLDQIEDMLAAQCMLLALRRGLDGQLVDVGAGHERLVAGAGEDDRAHGSVVLEQQRRAAQIVDGGGIEGVENLGAVDGDDGDRAIALEQEVVKVHRGTTVSISSYTPRDHARRRSCRPARRPRQPSGRTTSPVRPGTNI